MSSILSCAIALKQAEIFSCGIGLYFRKSRIRCTHVSTYCGYIYCIQLGLPDIALTIPKY